MGQVRDEMVAYMKVRGYAPKTITSYTTCVFVLAKYFNKTPLTISSCVIEAFFLNMREKGRKESTLRLYYEAIKFFYKSHGIMDRVPSMRFHKEIDRLPRILSPQDIERILASCTNMKFKTLFAIIYSSGLRISEALNLRLCDVDFERNTVFVHAGKNGKDRYTILAKSAQVLLKEYMTIYRPSGRVFYSTDRETGLSPETVRRRFRKIISGLGLDTRLSIHTLRHCFATHSIENGTSLFHVMHLLGHAHIETTMKYLHMRSPNFLGLASPLDALRSIDSTACPLFVKESPRISADAACSKQIV